jgi:hypothetical protein
MDIFSANTVVDGMTANCMTVHASHSRAQMYVRARTEIRHAFLPGGFRVTGKARFISWLGDNVRRQRSHPH